MSRTILASFIIMFLLSATSVLVIDIANGSGMIYFDQTYGGTNFDGARCVVQTADGGYALAGNTFSWGSGASDSWLVKTDGSGNHVWNQTYGGTNNEHAYSIVETVDGGYVLAGYTRASYESLPDFWLVKTDGSGNHVWNQTYGGLLLDRARCVVQTVDGGYALVGETYSYGAGEDDAWLVKTDEFGVIPEFPAWTLILLAVLIFAVTCTRTKFKPRSFSRISAHERFG